MLQFSTYSVITPEGCASILWRSAERARDAAEAMGLTAARLIEHGLIDQIIPERLGGAHRDPKTTAENLKAVVRDQIAELEKRDGDVLITQRYERLRGKGQYQAA